MTRNDPKSTLNQAGGSINHRAGYDFDKETKREALRLSHYRCEVCGKMKHETPEGFLSIHHLLPICIALEFYPEFSASLIASLANTMVVCVECHKEQDMLSMKYHEAFAQALLASTKQPKKPPRSASKVIYISSR